MNKIWQSETKERKKKERKKRTNPFATRKRYGAVNGAVSGDRNERFHLQVGALTGGALGHSLQAAISLLISDGTTEAAPRHETTPLTGYISLAISR